MILYYALGGGLGHITRSLSLIKYAPRTLLSRIRVLVSRSAAHVAEQRLPCPVDRVPDPAMTDSRSYNTFLLDHIERYRFQCIVMDTFPFGLVGEMKHLARGIPRVLVGRYLRWEAYRVMCGNIDDVVWPEDTVLIEEQEEDYNTALRHHTFVVTAQWPISPLRHADMPPLSAQPAICVVHSGPKSEVIELLERAKKIRRDKGMSSAPQIFTPSRNVFPMEPHLGAFTDIVTGAGYASCAAAALCDGPLRYHLHPFPRRFDDQRLRLERLKKGSWLNARRDGTARAAALLWDLVGLHT